MRHTLSPLGRCTLFGLVVFVLIGCTRRVDDTGDDEANTKALTDPWPRLVAGFRKETDAQTCRRLLSQLSSDISLIGKVDYQPEGLEPSAEPIYRERLGLTDSQLNDLRASNYSSLDGQYLAESLYLREVVRSLDLAGLPPERQVELAFAWVCRQVVLSPALRVGPSGSTQVLPPFPPTFALRRGSGTGLERAYVFLAVMQQLGLEGCLVGPEDALNQPWSYTGFGSKSPTPKGPFWAVGVRLGSEIKLFEPWRGEAFPGNLRELQADLTRLQPWVTDADQPWDGSAEVVKDSVPFLAYPLLAFAPRMKRLEQELRSTGGVRLHLEPATLLDQFAKETRSTKVLFWNPPQDPYCYPRVLSGFLPREEGGQATDLSLYGNYLGGSLPADLIFMLQTRKIPPQYANNLTPFLPSPQDPTGLPEAIERLATIALNDFQQSFLDNPLPRELIQRGQFFEVAPRLTKTRERYIQAENRLRSDKGREQDMIDWCERAKSLYLAMSQARSREDAGELAAARQKLDTHWQNGNSVISSVVDLITAETGLAEATYLLAVSTHEQAERAYVRYLQARQDKKPVAALQKVRANAYNACEESVGWWDKYKPYSSTQKNRFPGRAEQAEQLAQRMARLAAELKP